MKNYDLKLSEKIYDYYLDSNIGFNETCKACKTHSKAKKHTLINGPVPIFHIGNKFSASPLRLLFVGTVAYGWDEIKDNFMLENNEYRKKKKIKTIKWVEWRIDELFYNKRPGEKKRKYFTFIRESSKAIFGDDCFNKIALTNLAHCNEGSVANHLPQKVFNYCILNDKTNYFHKEIDILNPTHVILFSVSGKYTRYLNEIKNKGINTLATKHPSRANLWNFIKELKMFVKS